MKVPKVVSIKVTSNRSLAHHTLLGTVAPEGNETAGASTAPHTFSFAANGPVGFSLLRCLRGCMQDPVRGFFRGGLFQWHSHNKLTAKVKSSLWRSGGECEE